MPSSHECLPRARSRGGRTLVAALIIDSVGNGMFLPLSLLFFTTSTDVPLAQIGLLISLANTLTLPIPMIAGWLADRVGPLPLVVGAQIAQGTGYLIYTVADDPVGIFLSSSLVALGVRFFWSTVFTAIADFADGSTSSMSKDVWFAWASMARTAGFSVGSLITAAAISFANEAAYKALTVGAAVSFLVAGMVIGVGVRAPRRAHDTGEDGAAAGGYRGMLRDGPFLSYTGINAIFATTMTMLALGLPIFMADGLQGPSWLAPTLLAANTIALSLLTAPVAKRLAPYRRTRSSWRPPCSGRCGPFCSRFCRPGAALG